MLQDKYEYIGKKVYTYSLPKSHVTFWFLIKKNKNKLSSQSKLYLEKLTYLKKKRKLSTSKALNLNTIHNKSARKRRWESNKRAARRLEESSKYLYFLYRSIFTTSNLV